MAALWSHSPVHAQQITTPAPPSGSSSSNSLPDTPSEQLYPTAYPVPSSTPATPVALESLTQSYQDGRYDLDGNVVITYGDHILKADHILYDSNSGDVIATGHLILTGGANQEHITATHGTYNLKTSTGRFYEVHGSVAIKPRKPHQTSAIPADPTYANAGREVYSNGNPFLFNGRIVVKTGESAYDIYDGDVTSCQLPKPDWLLSGSHFSVADDKARATNSTFHLLGYPVLFLPYVTHPVNSEARQSGFLIPDVGQSSTKGFILGEQVYMTLGRSADLTVGADYYSSRGFAQAATFRYRGQGLDFVNVHYSGLLDRGYTPAGGVYTNQGGEDVVFAGRRDFNQSTRAAANVEYLSSYIYREAFTDNFNQAVTSDVVSTTYLTHEASGFEYAGFAQRYQGIKLIEQTAANGTTPDQEVHIFHAPALLFSSTDHHLGASSLEYSFDSSLAGLQRSQPNFSTGGIVERLDLHPQLALPFSLGGWRFRPSIAGRETLYTRSRKTPYLPAQPPLEERAGLSRADFEAGFEIRPPVIERDFETSGLVRKIFGATIRHTIEPEITYSYVGGISNFLNVLRFDETDVASDTNQLEYGVTQRLFRRHSLFRKDGTPRPCKAADDSQTPGLEPEAAADAIADADSTSGCSNQQLISWRLTQRHFFDPTFGHAVINGRRNIFDATLSLSGVAFLTEAREISPLISRLRLRSSANTDFEWDVDYDTGARKFTSNNVFVDVHRGQTFGALSYSLLDAPGRFYTEGVSSTVSSFNQLRLLIGYGQPTKPGLSLAGNTGLDLCPVAPRATATNSGTTATPTASCALLQYAALQASYNWNCCGLAMEYRKYELGSVRNEGVYRFNFTLANIGAAGNLKRAERLF